MCYEHCDSCFLIISICRNIFFQPLISLYFGLRWVSCRQHEGSWFFFYPNCHCVFSLTHKNRIAQKYAWIMKGVSSALWEAAKRFPNITVCIAMLRNKLNWSLCASLVCKNHWSEPHWNHSWAEQTLSRFAMLVKAHRFLSIFSFFPGYKRPRFPGTSEGYHLLHFVFLGIHAHGDLIMKQH